MTSPIDQATVPLLPTKDTALRLRHFSDSVYNVDETSALYSYVDALAGDSGVGTLKKEMLISRLSQSLDTTYFTDLDNTFGNLLNLTRLASETYPQNPATDILTADEWAEILVKDNWYRARIKNFFSALGLGGTPDGLRMMIKSALGVDTEVYEMWRFQDNYAEIYGVPDIEAISNLIVNPSFEYGDGTSASGGGSNIDGWATSSVGSGLPAQVSRDSVAPTGSTLGSSPVFTGSHYIGFYTGTNISNPSFGRTTLTTVSASKQYTLAFYYYKQSAATLTTLNVTINFINSSGGTISSSTSGNFTLSNNVNTRIPYTFTTPAGTVGITFLITLNGTLTGTGYFYGFDAFSLNSGATANTYFDGDTSGYRWTGPAASSSSVLASPIDALSRLKIPSRQEVILYPHKNPLSTLEVIEARNMTKRIAPVDSVITIATSGYAVNVPLNLLIVKSNSTYFQVSSFVTGQPGSSLTPLQEPNQSFRWVIEGQEVEAPTLAFLDSQEYSQYYLYDKTSQSSIDSVAYFAEDLHGNQRQESNYKTVTETAASWGPWTTYLKADSPDNYPGGKSGKTPNSKPALTKTGKPYIFSYSTQAQYVSYVKNTVLATGGQVTDTQYRVKINPSSQSVKDTWTPDMAVANVAPTRISTVTSGWYARPFTS